MSNTIIPQQPELPNESPFDAIRQVRADGSEFWSARDLMSLMGYSAWRNLLVPIGRAMQSAANQGMDVAKHFAESRKVSASGPDQQDFSLSRMAAYLVAMNGDPNKPEVAAAQAYFAIRTREAEVREQPKQLSGPELMAAALLEAHSVMEAQAQQLEAARPAIEYQARYVSNDDAVTVEAWGMQYGLTGPAAFKLLRDQCDVIRRINIGDRWSEKDKRVKPTYEYRARAGKKSYDWFTLRPQHNAPRHHNGQVRQTLYIRQAYAIELAKYVGLVAKETSNV